MEINPNFSGVRQSLRASHFPDRRRLSLLAQGRPGDIDELAEILEARQKIACRPNLLDQPAIRIIY